MKQYQTKIYSISWTLKATINPKMILNAISFSANINWWQWELRLDLGFDYDYSWISYWDIVKVYVTDKNHTHDLIYTGAITQIQRKYSWNFQWISIVAIWLFAFMTRVFFKDWSNYAFSKNQDPAQTIKDIVDYFNSVYTAGFFSYTGVANYGSNINIAFDYNKCNDAIKEVQKATDSFYFYIWSDWNVIYKEKDWVVTHKFTLEKDVLSLNSNENIESLANNVFVEYSWGVANKSDATSQSSYWLIETKINSQANDSASANIYAQDYLDQNKDFKKETTLVINSKYDIETIKPWDYIKLQNTKYWIDWVQILKTQYTFDKVVCYLDKYSSLSQEISLIK